MQIQARGFTLIELLVVIAIIGILSSVLFTSLSGSRTTGRDSNRIVSLQHMSRAIALADGDPAKLFTGCTAVGPSTAPTSANDVSGCTGPMATTFAGYKDPKNPSTVCTYNSSVPCQYMIAMASGAAGNPTTQNFEICTYIEGAVSATLLQGMVRIDSTTGGSVKSGCF